LSYARLKCAYICDEKLEILGGSTLKHEVQHKNVLTTVLLLAILSKWQRALFYVWACVMLHVG
jgi:hypothetical protein